MVIELHVVQFWSEFIFVVSNGTRAARPSNLKSRVWFQTKLHSTQFNYHYLSRESQAKHQVGARAFWAAASPALPNHWLLLIYYRSYFFRQAAVNNGKKHMLVNGQESLPTSLLQQITVGSGSTEGTGSSGMCQCRCTCGGQSYHIVLVFKNGDFTLSTIFLINL